jgi:6-phosphogluconolactonase
MSTTAAGVLGATTPVDDVPRAFAEAMAAAFAARPGPRFTLVCSGGPTGRECYEATARHAGEAIDWSLVDLYVGDERLVPPDDPASNARLIRETLIEPVGGVGSFTPMPTSGSPSDCAAEYQAVIRAAIDGPGLDLVHLGLGPDGHTASLFPDSEALEPGQGVLVAPSTDPHGRNPLTRLTFTFEAIACARLVVITVESESNHQAVAEVRRGTDLPAGRVRAAEVRWLIDATTMAAAEGVAR